MGRRRLGLTKILTRGKSGDRGQVGQVGQVGHRELRPANTVHPTVGRLHMDIGQFLSNIGPKR